MPNAGACPGEGIQQSKASPGPVTDPEGLVRVVIHPLHAEADGSLKSSAISMDELRGGGASVVRRNFLTHQQMEDFCNSLITGKASRKICGALSAPAGELRAIKDSKGVQVFCIVDDGDPPSIPAHALILWSGASPEPPRKFRGMLVERLGRLRSIDSLYANSAA